MIFILTAMMLCLALIFSACGGTGIGNSATNLHGLAEGATWLSGMRFSSTASQSEVEEWVNGLWN